MSQQETTYQDPVDAAYRVLKEMRAGRLTACKAADATGDPAKIWKAHGEFCGVDDAVKMVGDLIAAIRKAGRA